jgi:thiaminase/transcriptional activator TenA
MQFTDRLWHSISELYQNILAQPFNRELKEGTLDREIFRHYIAQDSLYLAEFGRALAIVASKISPIEKSMHFLKFAEGAIVVERALHQHYFQEFQISHHTEMSPACQHYTSYLLATASLKPVEVAIAALLPCFWIYQAVGLHILKRSAPQNIYQSWIDTYASEEFRSSVELAISLTEEAANQTTENIRQQMMDAFMTSSQLEYRFWDSAYRLETWRIT